MSDLPKVLLLGDSIRMSYQPLVTQLLDGQAQVVGPADNCQYSLFTLSSLERWIGALGEADIVHWNNGLHDCGHNPNRNPVQIPLEMYRANLGFILRRLRAMTAKIVWATITPVHPQRPFRDDQWAWRNAEIDQYNAAALGLMQAEDLAVNDLHGVVGADLDGNLNEDQLHLSETGIAHCAEAVVSAVLSQLR